MKDEESEEHEKESKGPVNQEVTLDLSDGSSTTIGEADEGEGGVGDEGTLEDIADDPEVRESQNFSEAHFEGAGEGKMPSGTLQSDSSTQSQSVEIPVSNLEQSASSSIGETSGRTQEKQFEERRERPERLYKGAYSENMPAYEGSVSEELASNRRKIEEGGGSARTFDDLRQTQRRVIPGNPEMEEARRRGTNAEDPIREYTANVEVQRPDDSPKDVMRRERTYRIMRR